MTLWLTAGAALERLGTKPQTLYANVSRGRVRAKPDPADSRRSLYAAEDVDRLAERHRGRRAVEAIATGTIRWGDPVLESAVSTVIDGRLLFRGTDAVQLSETATYEAAAGLLLELDGPLPSGGDSGVQGRPHLSVMFDVLAGRAASDLPSHGRAAGALQREAAEVLVGLGAAVCGDAPVPLHERLASALGCPEAADALRRALVLLADHELNASTFAARVAGSTGAPLAAGALAGLCALSGPRHGTAAGAAAVLAARAEAAGADRAVREVLAEGRAVPALGHPLYPGGDPRATALLEAIEVPAAYAALSAAALDLAGERPNIDFALAALTAAYRLPPETPVLVFALARAAGWMAHLIEQAGSGVLIRPRARYVGRVT